MIFPISDPDIARKRFPVVNVSLIAISIVVFLYSEFVLDSFELTKFYNNYGVVPFELTGQGDISGMFQAEDVSVLEVEGVRNQLIFYRLRDVYEGGPPTVWLTLFTSMFMHVGWVHLIGNMLFLWIFGDNVEDRLGRVKYLFFYLICGLFAAAAQVAVNLDTGVPLVGASGAIAGVLGAYLVLFPTSRIRTLMWFIFIIVLPIPAWLLIVVYMLRQFFSGISTFGGEWAGGVAYWAHIGGFVAGFLIVAAFVGLSGVRRIFSNIYR